MNGRERNACASEPIGPSGASGEIVIATETPARDQLVPRDSGSRKMASENIAPRATQVMSAPIPTMVQR